MSRNNLVVQQEWILQCFIHDEHMITRLFINTKRFFQRLNVTTHANKAVLVYCDSMTARIPGIWKSWSDQTILIFVINTFKILLHKEGGPQEYITTRKREDPLTPPIAWNAFQTHVKRIKYACICYLNLFN